MADGQGFLERRARRRPSLTRVDEAAVARLGLGEAAREKLLPLPQTSNSLFF